MIQASGLGLLRRSTPIHPGLLPSSRIPGVTAATQQGGSPSGLGGQGEARTSSGGTQGGVGTSGRVPHGGTLTHSGGSQSQNRTVGISVDDPERIMKAAKEGNGNNGEPNMALYANTIMKLAEKLTPVLIVLLSRMGEGLVTRRKTFKIIG